MPQPVGRRPGQGRQDRVLGRSSPATPGTSISSKPGQPGLQPAQRLLQRFLEGPADRHHLAHRLHRGGEQRLGLGELLEGEARDLGDDVVDRGLERGRRGAGDVVLDLVQRVADGELGRDLGDREAGGLGRQRASSARRAGSSRSRSSARRRGRSRTGRWSRRYRPRSRAGPRSRRRASAGIPCRSGSAPGATVMLSPVWTPIGSMFSIEQTMMQLSARSRTTSISYSFQPRTDSSISTSPIGEASRPEATICVELLAVVGDAAAGAAQREGGPDDRRQADLGQRVASLVQRAARRGCCGRSRPIRTIAWRNSSRSSALSIASGDGADQLDAELARACRREPAPWRR